MLPARAAEAILFVDDEALSRKWFARAFADEFQVVTAAGAAEALAVLAERGEEFAVLVTDYRMPERDGVKLLRAVQREHRHLVRLLATAYAEKDVAIAAVNLGKVFRILEKPLDEALTREALRETLGFLAHELNTPLATVRGCVSLVASRHQPAQEGEGGGVARFQEDHPGELLAALERAERRALYCQSLVSTFVQSARDAYPGRPSQSVSAQSLVEALMDEFPFEDNERSAVTSEVFEDFHLPGRRDLLYLVLCTLAKNALQAMRGQPGAQLRIEVGVEHDARGRPWIRFTDNGPGIPPQVLAKLTREPVTTKGGAGTGMGLMFCQRVMQSAGGSIEIESHLGEGTFVTLYFKAAASA